MESQCTFTFCVLHHEGGPSRISSDLSSEAFIAAFKRFLLRRGRPAHIYSDNGTTFVDAHKQIQELYDMYNDPQVQSEIKNFLRELEISWSFP